MLDAPWVNNKNPKIIVTTKTKIQQDCENTCMCPPRRLSRILVSFGVFQRELEYFISFKEPLRALNGEIINLKAHDNK